MSSSATCRELCTNFYIGQGIFLDKRGDFLFQKIEI